MYRLRLAAATPEYVERGRGFKLQLQLCQENGAVLPPPHAAAAGGCPVKVSLRAPGLQLIPGEELLSVESAGGGGGSGGSSGGGGKNAKGGGAKGGGGGATHGKVLLGPDGACTVRVAVSVQCNKLHYGPGHTTECLHVIGGPLFLHAEVTVPAAQAPGGEPEPEQAGKKSGGSKQAKKGGGQKKAAAGKKVGKPQGTVVTAVSPAILIGAEAAKLEWAELAPPDKMAKQLLALSDRVPGKSGGGVELVLCERGQLYEDTLPGFGAVIWDSAYILARHIACSFGAKGLRGKKVVEIGCGVALPGLAAAACGAAVLLTDQPACIEIPIANAEANATRIKAAGGSASCAALSWGGLGSEPVLVASKGPFDYVLCSDCVYDNDAFDMLATTLAGLSSSHTTVLVAFKERKMNGRGSGCEVERFFERVGLDFTAEPVTPGSSALAAEVEATVVSSMISAVRLYQLKPRRKRLPK